MIGGGYAGTLAANHLQTRRDVAVTLVNPRPEFVERIRLHQMVADTGSATVDYSDMLHPAFRCWSTPPPRSTPRTGTCGWRRAAACATTT